MWVYGLDLAVPGQRHMADACESGNEPWGQLNAGNFLTSCIPALQNLQKFLLKNHKFWIVTLVSQMSDIFSSLYAEPSLY